MAEQARILVVDDEPAVQNALFRALTLEHYDVAQASDGREALERLEATPYEAVILDIAMPRMDGLEVCGRLRAGGDRTPVLMLTARGEVDDRVAGLDAGADDYLVKPFALRELLARVRALLRRAGEEDGEPADAQLRGSAPRPPRARGLPRRADARAHAHRVPAAGDVPAPSAPGAHALGDLRARVGL